MSGAEHSRPMRWGGPPPAGSTGGREDDAVDTPGERIGSPLPADDEAAGSTSATTRPQPGPVGVPGRNQGHPAAVPDDGRPAGRQTEAVGDATGENVIGENLTGQEFPEPQRAGVDATDGLPTRQRPGRGGRGGRGSFARELPLLVLIAFLLALLIKAFLVQAFWIPTVSMERTLLVNDRVLVNKLVYRFRDVHRGEIVVFNGDGTGFERAEVLVTPPGNVFSRALRSVQGMLGLGAPSDKDFIKRVIGVGGDTVACCDAQGRVTVNGQPLDEPYVYENSPLGGGREFEPVKVPPGELWVMGDHRGESSDSRVNGTIPQSKVVGRAFVRVWPLSRMAILSPPNIFAAAGAQAAGAAPLAGAGLAGAAMVGVATTARRRRASPGTLPTRPVKRLGRNAGDDNGDGPSAHRDGRRSRWRPAARRGRPAAAPPAVRADRRGGPR
ncbi:MULTISPECIES: signal peptidase I [Protofrankia]|uniref:Signal peptidase I n=1 Tax=Candidatus Protofrankia datiscae TaxID=2716812 RepID=F8B441_9ACTN|nr:MULTISPECIES: signal peptidase I [Protofrankia]AEH10949.1 signal peptidase I [Candidatus Protofrankia datiscae]